MARESRKKLTQPIPFREFDFSAKECGGHLVGLIAHDQIPLTLRSLQLRLHILISGELVEPCDDEIVFSKPISSSRSLELVISHNLERKLETPVEFILPLLGETARADDEAPLEVATYDKFFDEQSRHDRFSCARIVGQ